MKDLKRRSLLCGLGVGVFLFFLLAESEAARAQLKLDVSFGFNGRFLPDHLVPVFVKLTNQGLAVSGQLEFSQNVENPLQGSFKQDLKYKIDLEAEAVKRFEFQIFVHGYIYPLVIRFRSGEITLAETKIDLREMFADGKLAISISDPSMGKRLPNGQAIEPLAIEALPTHWVAFDGVQRIYLGRLDTNLLSKPQQEAIREWVLWGGELIVLGGENWRVQRSSWLADLIPLAIEEIRLAKLGEIETSFAVGKPKDETFEIREQKDDTILISRRPYGMGSVVFYSIDPLKAPIVPLPEKSETLAKAWQLWETLAPEVGKQLLDKIHLQYPNRGLLTLVLGGLILGFAFFSTLLLKHGISQRAYGVIIFFIFLGASSFLVVYVNQPIYTSTVQSMELSVERRFAHSDRSVQQTWYSLFTERGSLFQLELPAAFLRQANKQHPNDLSLQLTDESLKAQFYVLAQQQEHFVTEEIKPARVTFAVDRAVRPMKVSVYNGEETALGPGIIRMKGENYQIGGVAAGERKTFLLTTKLEGKEITDASESDANLFEMKKALYSEVLKSAQDVTLRWAFVPGRGWKPVRATIPGISEPLTEATWFTWGKSALFSSFPGENRLKLKLFIVGEARYVAE